MAHSKRQDSRHRLKPGDAIVSNDDGNAHDLLNQHGYNAAFNGVFFAKKIASAYHPPLSVITACDEAQRTSEEWQDPKKISERDSILSTERPVPTLNSGETFFTAPPTPPETPRSTSNDMRTEEMSFQSPTNENRSFIFPPLRTRQLIASIPRTARPRRSVDSKNEAGLFTPLGTFIDWPEKREPSISEFYGDTITRLVRAGRLEPGDRERLLPSPLLDIPCMHDSLIHLLRCGHKIATVELEPCAANCCVRTSPEFVQIRDLEGVRYMCMVCITDHVRASLDAEHRQLTEEFSQKAVESGKTGDWVRQNLDILVESYPEGALKGLGERSKNEKFGIPVSWIEPYWQQLVDEVVEKRLRAEQLLKKPSRASIPSSAAEEMPSPPQSASTTALPTKTLPSTQTWPISRPQNPFQKIFSRRQNRETVQLWGQISKAATMAPASSEKAKDNVVHSTPELPCDPRQRETRYMWNNINAASMASEPNPKPQERVTSSTPKLSQTPDEEKTEHLRNNVNATDTMPDLKLEGNVVPAAPELGHSPDRRETRNLWNNINATDPVTPPSLTSRASTIDEEAHSVVMPPTPSSVYSQPVAENEQPSAGPRKMTDSDIKPWHERTDLLLGERRALSLEPQECD